MEKNINILTVGYGYISIKKKTPKRFKNYNDAVEYLKPNII